MSYIVEQSSPLLSNGDGSKERTSKRKSTLLTVCPFILGRWHPSGLGLCTNVKRYLLHCTFVNQQLPADVYTAGYLQSVCPTQYCRQHGHFCHFCLVIMLNYAHTHFFCSFLVFIDMQEMNFVKGAHPCQLQCRIVDAVPQHTITCSQLLYWSRYLQRTVF